MCHGLPIGGDPAVVCLRGAAGDGTGLGVCGRREGMGDVLNEITRNHAGLAEMLRGQISG